MSSPLHCSPESVSPLRPSHCTGRPAILQTAGSGLCGDLMLVNGTNPHWGFNALGKNRVFWVYHHANEWWEIGLEEPSIPWPFPGGCDRLKDLLRVLGGYPKPIILCGTHHQTRGRDFPPILETSKIFCRYITCRISTCAVGIFVAFPLWA